MTDTFDVALPGNNSVPLTSSLAAAAIFQHCQFEFGGVTMLIVCMRWAHE